MGPELGHRDRTLIDPMKTLEDKGPYSGTMQLPQDTDFIVQFMLAICGLFKKIGFPFGSDLNQARALLP